ncbi:unnamed protein product [Adineta steineri]|uniref:Uncharacterized protein n=1 Tax=Adineta steineri TaxID=433720 RepID=A0A813NWQ2_9BILA|nr:unnamed protein product [Adineta steineri]
MYFAIRYKYVYIYDFSTNQQLAQKAQEGQKQSQHNGEKLLKELQESRTLHMNQINEYKRRIEELELNNEQLRQKEIAHVEPQATSSLNNEERQKFEQEINKLNQENEQYKKKFDEIQNQYQSKENQLRQEIEQLKNNSEQRQHEENLNNELRDKNAQIDALKAELEEAKAKNDLTNSQSNERLQQEQEKQKQLLIELLEQDARNQLQNDNQDFNKWLSSYKQILTSSIETNKRVQQDEAEKYKRENDQLHKNMNDIENQLKEIEQTVQSKEETLLADLKNKDAILEQIQNENDQLRGELGRLRIEIDRLQTAHNTAINDTHALKRQLDERILVNDNSSSFNGDESFEFVKQSPSLPSTEGNTRVEQLHELIRSSKEVLDNQDSIVQQLDRHINEMHRGGAGETSTSNVDESTMSSSSSSFPSAQQEQQTAL